LYSFSEKLVPKEEIDEKNNYENKLNELTEIYDKLKADENSFKSSEDIYKIYNSLNTLIGRIIREISNAKYFKINRNEFLGNVAHEMRTPIFAIQLSLETLYDGAVNDAAVNMDFLSKAMNNTKRLNEMVDDLITISKLETGMKLSKRYFGINNFLSDVIEEIKYLSDTKNINIVFNSDVSDKVQVFADSEKIKQVIINLIDNAVKYTPENGEIKINTISKDKEILISVEDNGAGIPKEDLPRIFERFYRVEKDRSREKGGSGLGLSIVKHILELHNSRITVDSELNKGTKFEFNLPR
jgi:two-component system phosphate regulon sensor histidine kinase PhoR